MDSLSGARISSGSRMLSLMRATRRPLMPKLPKMMNTTRKTTRGGLANIASWVQQDAYENLVQSVIAGTWRQNRSRASLETAVSQVSTNTSPLFALSPTSVVCPVRLLTTPALPSVMKLQTRNTVGCQVRGCNELEQSEHGHWYAASCRDCGPPYGIQRICHMHL